ncbi:hypothetical protein RAS2_24940 [Phycisphaerae bacterium RAS2]|nr:hypothetical protein RAS2_24940 [Phycisphaerae bacterium RAS2]
MRTFLHSTFPILHSLLRPAWPSHGEVRTCHRVAWLRPWAPMLAAIATLTAGCSGSGRVNFVSLNMTDIDPPPAKAWQFDAAECYWWLDDQGDLNIALRSVRDAGLLGKLGRVELCISFVLDGPPAGSGRNYPIRQREVRAVALNAMQTHRFTSFAGIAGVSTLPNQRYRGSFRAWMHAHSEMSMFNVMPNRPSPLLCFGNFEAVYDPARGRALRERSESSGFARPAKPRAPGGATTRQSPAENASAASHPTVSDTPTNSPGQSNR